MSARRRGGVRSKDHIRRSTIRALLRDNDDIPLSFLLAASVGGFGRSTPKKRTPKPKRQIPQPRACEAQFTIISPAIVATTDVIDLDETPVNQFDIDMLDNVEKKVGGYMRGYLDRDEETEMIKSKSKTNKKTSGNLFWISDDSSDDDVKIEENRGLVIDISEASTSGAHINVSKPSTSANSTYTSGGATNLSIGGLERDIFEFVDNLEPVETTTKTETSIEDFKSLEEYRKETEEMMKNISTILDDFKKPKKPEPAPAPAPAPSPEKAAVTVGCCPICLDSLADRAAAVTLCGHIFCKECILAAAKTLKKCPTCRKAINAKKIHPIYF